MLQISPYTAVSAGGTSDRCRGAWRVGTHRWYTLATTVSVCARRTICIKKFRTKDTRDGGVISGGGEACHSKLWYKYHIYAKGLALTSVSFPFSPSVILVFLFSFISPFIHFRKSENDQKGYLLSTPCLQVSSHSSDIVSACFREGKMGGKEKR